MLGNSKEQSQRGEVLIRKWIILFKNSTWGGLLGGSVVKNLAANAGNMGSIPGLGRFLMLY